MESALRLTIFKSFLCSAKCFILGLLLIVVTTTLNAQTIKINNDGWELAGTLSVPKKERTMPVVLLLHKAGGSRKDLDQFAARLSVMGIASLRLDLRGHGESVNKGKFGPPFDEKTRAILDGTDTDISAAIEFIKNSKLFDNERIGVFGASYSGEEMAKAGRKIGFVKAYAALSPGSFSDASIASLDREGTSWLFVRSAEERFLKGMHEKIRSASKTAQLLEVGGDKHATDLFDSNPELMDLIAIWFRAKLGNEN